MTIDTVNVNGSQSPSSDEKAEAVVLSGNGEIQASSQDQATEPEVVALSVRGESDRQLNIKPYHATTLPQNRPIVHSDIQVSHVIPGIEARPVLVSNHQIAENLPGLQNRPVFSSDNQNAPNLPGLNHRPVVESNIEVSEGHTILGNRPVVTKQIQDKSKGLMGYLD